VVIRKKNGYTKDQTSPLRVAMRILRIKKPHSYRQNSDPDTYYKQTKKLKLSESVEDYTTAHFRSCLKSSVRKAIMAPKKPLPHAHPKV